MTDVTILDGTKTAKAIRLEVASRVAALKERTGVTTGLAAVLAGDNPASVTYVAMKRKACAAAGIHSEVHIFDSAATTDDILACVTNLNNNPNIHGILVQHPLPKGIDEHAILAAVSPDKGH